MGEDDGTGGRGQLLRSAGLNLGYPMAMDGSCKGTRWWTKWINWPQEDELAKKNSRAPMV